PKPFAVMKTLYLDIFSGISGDMFIGALIDLGVDPAQLDAELKKLRVGGYHLHVGRGQKSGISGIKFDVHLEDHHAHGAEHDAGAPHGHEHHHAHAHEQAHGHSHAHSHSHSHPHNHDHDHDHWHIPTGPHGGPLLETGSGQVELSVFETKVP